MKPKLSLKPHAELPLKQDSANLFLQIMTASSVFVFSLILAAFLVLDGLAENWRHGMDNTLTVQIMPAHDTLSAVEETARRQKVVMFFENMPEVEQVNLLSDDQMQKLMAPWLGMQADLSVLPLPSLLDVKLKKGVAFDYENAAAELAEAAPYASLDNHRLWLGRLVRFAGVLRFLALIILGVVLLVSALSIFYAVCTSLGIHREIIEILHIMGAKDSYIAGQYARRSFFIGLFAGMSGALLGIAAIWGIGSVAVNLNTALLGGLALKWPDWLLIATLPLWSAILSMLTAWISVERTLRKMT